MQFLRIIRSSIYDPVFCTSVRTENLGSALKQYTLFILSVAVLLSIPLYIFLGSEVSKIKRTGDIRGKTLALYPDELVLTFRDGQLSSNVEEPYSIPTLPEFSGEVANLVVISTREPIALADFERYDTIAILGNDAVWTLDAEKNQIQIQKFDQFSKEDMVINEQKVTEFVDMAMKVGKTVITILFIFLPLIVFVFLWLSYLSYLFLGALVIWVVAKIRKVNLTYGQSYKIGLYLLTLPILYDVLTTGPLSMFHIPFLFTVILAVVAYTNLVPKIKEPIERTIETAKVPQEEPIEFFPQEKSDSTQSVVEEKK